MVIRISRYDNRYQLNMQNNINFDCLLLRNQRLKFDRNARLDFDRESRVIEG